MTRRMAVVLALLALPVAASASPLGDGIFKGQKMGTNPLLEAPVEGCVRSTDTGVAWACATTLGGQPADVAFMGEHGIFYGSISVTQGYEPCHQLLRTLTTAWGIPRQDNKYIEDYAWREGRYSASWEWNKYRKTCQVVVLDGTAYARVEKIKASEAATSTGDL